MLWIACVLRPSPDHNLFIDYRILQFGKIINRTSHGCRYGEEPLVIFFLCHCKSVEVSLTVVEM